jgi:hypothetical protein
MLVVPERAPIAAARVINAYTLTLSSLSYGRTDGDLRETRDQGPCPHVAEDAQLSLGAARRVIKSRAAVS